jgi:hypothetical protein
MRLKWCKNTAWRQNRRPGDHAVTCQVPVCWSSAFNETPLCVCVYSSPYVCSIPTCTWPSGTVSYVSKCQYISQRHVNRTNAGFDVYTAACSGMWRSVVVTRVVTDVSKERSVFILKGHPDAVSHPQNRKPQGDYKKPAKFS